MMPIPGQTDSLGGLGSGINPAAAIGGLATLGAGYMDYRAQNNTNDANSAMAAANRDFQQRMYERGLQWNEGQVNLERARQDYYATHGYQMKVQDMIDAGLNPILAAGGGGASSPEVKGSSPGTPSGSTATMVAPRIVDAVRSSVATAFEGKRLEKDLETADAGIDLQKAAKVVKDYEGVIMSNNARKAKVEADLAVESKTSRELEIQNREDYERYLRGHPELNNIRKYLSGDTASGVVNAGTSVLKALQ